MWWLDPGKEILNIVFNRILAPYVENLDMNQVNYGIAQGQLTLRNLRLKKAALDKFRLPVDVLEGYLGTFTLSLYWMNLGNKPVEILIEDVYLLVVPSPQNDIDPKEEEERTQAAKQERLENAELLHMRGQADVTQGSPQGLWSSLAAKIVNNLQVTVKNIHIRYEDSMSVPGCPFAAGVTLANFSARSVDEQWQPAFIESTSGAIHKLANLSSLAIYFDTDAQSMADLSMDEVKEKFKSMIPLSDKHSSHQFILSPVSGEGRIVLNHKLDDKTPQYDIHLLFGEIGVALDVRQYRSAISLVDMYHVYLRRHQYRKFRPSDDEISRNRGRAYLKFAMEAILDGVHERRRKWTWEYFLERRDTRRSYVEVFKRKLMNVMRDSDAPILQSLERKLSYEDIRFYRSIARSQLRKDAAQRKTLEGERVRQQQQSRGWSSWLWGTPTTEAPSEDPVFSGKMTEEQRKQLYEVLDYDERAAIAEAFETPRDALKMRVASELKKGSFALKTNSSESVKDIVSTIFDSFRAELIQRPDNFELSISLGDFSVHDGTCTGTVHPQIVQVKKPSSNDLRADVLDEPNEPFFFVKFESNPLDQRADTAFTARLRHMEIIYHRGYLEAITKFFRPPKSQLESVEALLNVASQTLEGLRKGTRAGLEYALESHKTVDLQVDINAPLIIVPEDITSIHGGHLIIDAGHISIESDLAGKDILREIQAKKNQQYDDDDYRRLESMMYDKMLLKLETAQFVIGNDLQSCREALTSEKHDHLHLLERTSIELRVQSSIVPSAINLARFKVAGKLPNLHVNVSDAKYKILMRLIDVAIPNLDEDLEGKAESRQTDIPPVIVPLSTGLFGSTGPEYNIEDSLSEAEDTSNSRKDIFFDASDGTSQNLEAQQQLLNMDFAVDELRASILKSSGDGTEKLLGDLRLQHFRLAFSLLRPKMFVTVNLKKVTMDVVRTEKDPLQLMSSEHDDVSEDKDLLSISYRRIQKTSPDFYTSYEGIEQSVDVCLSTFIFKATPEPVISLYDFIMSTFVPQQTNSIAVQAGPDAKADSPSTAPGIGGTIRVAVKLDSIAVILINDVISLATLCLSTAHVSILMKSSTMSIGGKIGSLALSDDRSVDDCHPEFKQILSTEGQDFAEFHYQTYGPTDEPFANVKSSIDLTTGSLKVHFLEQPLRDIYLFVIKLAKLKVLYDAARDAAVQKASEIERMQFKVSIRTPIIVFPTDSTYSPDVLTMRLGEISANNSYNGNSSRITAGLKGIHVVSELYYDGQVSSLKLVDDIDIAAEAFYTPEVDRLKESNLPDTQVAIRISDIKLHLTQIQFKILLGLSQSIPRIFSPDSTTQISGLVTPSPSESSEDSVDTGDQPAKVNLEPEIRITSVAGGIRPWTTVDVATSVNAVTLHLYDATTRTRLNLKDHAIVRLTLDDATLRYKSTSDGAVEAQIVLKSFTMNNMMPGASKFREIIPAARHGRNQFMVLYTASGLSSLAIVTIDSPHVIFAIEPLVAVISFFTSGVQSMGSSSEADDSVSAVSREPVAHSETNIRLELHDVSISILEDDSNAHSQAVRLYINQILMSRQRIVALTVDKVGMSLIRMGADSDTVRLLDDVDVVLSLDRQSSNQEQFMNVEISIKPVVFRASYRDIMLITTIVTKALQLYNKSQESSPLNEGRPPTSEVTRYSASQTYSGRTMGKARVMLSKEQMKATVDGFRLILIGDMHEQPILHLNLRPFVTTVKDWSSEFNASTILETQINYWNLTNSHWEPLIDPWKLTLSAAKDHSSDGFRLSVAARDRLDLNISTTFIELALSFINMLSRESEGVLQKARGSAAPYRIRNRTGSPLLVWSSNEAHTSSNNPNVVKIDHLEIIDWRFDDWKTMREHVTAYEQHSIGIQIAGKPWEAIRGIPVDREGEFTFSLRSGGEGYINRLLCAVTVENNVKVVTLRSTYLIENRTFYPLELMLADNAAHPAHSLEKILPGQDYALPIDAVTQYRIRLQPDQGFGYKWCSSLRFDDLIKRRSLTISCPHSDKNESPFRIQAWVQADSAELAARKLPKIKLRLHAPIELENLLPYNLKYQIFDKHENSIWKSYLRKGGVMPVHSVELEHLVLLSVEIQDTVFKRSDFAIINSDSQSDFNIESRLPFSDPKNPKLKLNLKLNYIRYPESGRAFKVQIYSPYVVVNKTGMPFGVKTVRSNRTSSPMDVAGDTEPGVIASSTPFLLSHPHDNGHAFVFQVEDSIWSNVIGLEAPSAETKMVLPSSKEKNAEYHIGLSWAEGHGKYKLSKIITLAPRFLLKNNLSEPLQIREYQGSRRRTTINPGERWPLQLMRTSQEKLLTISRPGFSPRWSAPINLENIGVVHLRLPSEENENEILKANVEVDGSTIFVSFSKSDIWPFQIENQSEHAVSLTQKDASRIDPLSTSHTYPRYKLAPHSTISYAWDQPAAKEKKLMLMIHDARREVDVMEIGVLIPFKFHDHQRTRAVSLDVRADGHMQVLRITPYSAKRSVYKPKHKSAESLSRSDTLASVEAFEAVLDEHRALLTVKVDLAGIGVSLMNRKIVEVVYVSADSLQFEYIENTTSHALSLSCGSLQIDNQLQEAVYSVILQPSPISNELGGASAALPTVQAYVVWLKDQEHGVIFIKYCSVLLQALTIETDEDLLFALYDLTQIKGASWEEGSEDVLIPYPDEIPEPQTSPSGSAIYFELLELHPIQLTMSFTLTGQVSGENKLSTRNPLAVMVNALTMTLGNVNDARLQLNALVIKDMRQTLPELQSRIAFHYRQEVLRQLYRILFSADFIGNPVGLFTNVSSGVADIFYAPYHGVVMRGNKELGIGIAKGAASFVKKTVFGLSDSFTKFTSSVSKGLSAATFDSEYQAQRRVSQRRNRPRHAIYGVTAGSEALATSVLSAMEGIVSKPIQGAEEEGAVGFFKGMGKGFVGVVTKPAVGIFDLAANLSEGIRNTTTVFDKPERDRIRLPRHVPPDGVLVPYSDREALGQYWMKDLENGTYRSQSYVAHINLPVGDNIVLLTTSGVLAFGSKRLRLDWDLPFKDVQGISTEENGIQFTNKLGRDHDKFILIPDKHTQDWFFGQLASIVKAFNARRRMDN